MSDREPDGDGHDALWDEFCERLKRAGRVLGRASTPRDPLTRAEGYRHLVRLVRVAFEAVHEYGDPRHPCVYRSVGATTSGEGETSDARYHQAFIDGSETYRLTGTRGTAPLIELTAYEGKIGLEATSRQVGALTERDLEVASDGSFEVGLGPEPGLGSWIRTTPATTLLFIRQYAHDWSRTQSASFAIRREPAPAGRRPPASLDEVRRALERSAAFVDAAAHFWAGVVDRRAAAEPNLLHEIPIVGGAGQPTMPVGHRFAAGWFRIEPDQALVVEFSAPEVPYWGLDLTNYWFEPLSYDDHRSHRNDRTATRAADGSVRLVIAQADPGVPNWLDTLGHREGTMLFRWSRTAEPLPRFATRVVPLRDLAP